MKTSIAVMARGLVVSFLLLCGLAVAAPVNSGTDPLAAIDLHRNAIISDIVKGFEAQAGAEGAAKLKARLEGLRADGLLAASLASSRESLDLVLAGAASPQSAAVTQIRQKSLGDASRDLLYTPLTPCRLVDTRGNGAPIQGGAFAPGERRAYVPAGACGIPATGVATMLISFTTQNLNPASGGVLAILAPSAPFTSTADVFNLGSIWSASNTAVATGGAGQFDVYVLIANAHVVVDVLGYFAPLQGNITLAESTATVGNIMKGANSFIHNFGFDNTFIGEGAGNFATTGGSNTALGVAVLAGNTTGGSNTASGVAALTSNTGGSQNTAMGYTALAKNLSGGNNTAIGVSALANNTTGENNNAMGVGTLLNNTTGNQNTASGVGALQNNTTGTGNIALGPNAGINQTTGSGNIYIGNAGVATENDTIRIGSFNVVGDPNRFFVAGVRGITTGLADGVAVLIDSVGQLGTISSSRRFKDDIADMDAASSALMDLRPVTFHYKTDRNPSGRTLQYGLIAEEVAQVYPGLVARSADGQVETVMYQFLPSMLLNEVQKQHRTIRSQAEHVAQLENDRQLQATASARQADEIAGLKRAVAEIGELKRQMAHMARLLEPHEGTGSVTAGLGLR
jgi:hypothetical protein